MSTDEKKIQDLQFIFDCMQLWCERYGETSFSPFVLLSKGDDKLFCHAQWGDNPIEDYDERREIDVTSPLFEFTHQSQSEASSTERE